MRSRSERFAEVRQLVHQHLTAAMIMVPIQDRIDPRQSVASALAYLKANGFDLAVLDTPEMRVVLRSTLESIPPDKRQRIVKERSVSPPFDRLIAPTLELGEVARRLQSESTPLLVVGRSGPEHVVTRADFTRPAGAAGVLAMIAILDAALDDLLQPHDDAAWDLLSADERNKITDIRRRARRVDEDVSRVSYLTLARRIEFVRRLGLLSADDRRFGSRRDHELLVSVRNSLAHGREAKSGADVLQTMVIADGMLALATESPS